MSRWFIIAATLLNVAMAGLSTWQAQNTRWAFYEAAGHIARISQSISDSMDRIEAHLAQEPTR